MGPAGPAHKFNTLDNWGHKTPTQSKKKEKEKRIRKKKKEKKKREKKEEEKKGKKIKEDKGQKRKVQGSWPETCIQYTQLHL